MRGDQDATRGSCMVCATDRPLNDDGEWLELDARISAGHRGATRFQAQPTQVEGLVICPECYAAPGGAYLRVLIEQRYQAPIELDRGCHVTCRGRVRRRRGGLVSRMVSGDSPLLCPVCYGKAGYALEEPAPRPEGALDRFRPRMRAK